VEKSNTKQLPARASIADDRAVNKDGRLPVSPGNTIAHGHVTCFAHVTMY